MKMSDVKIGGLYHAKVSDKLATVRIDSTHAHGGWNAVNTATGKRIRIKSAQRLRGPAQGAAKTGAGEATAKADEGSDRGPAPRSELTLEEAATLQQVRATKVKKTQAADGQVKTKRVSALDAAAQVLARASEPMRAPDLIAAMAEQGLWQSPGGKTPHATLYAAMMREQRQKGEASRFRKVDRGMFAFNGKEA